MKRIVQIGLTISLLNTSVLSLNAVPLDDYSMNTAERSVQKAVPSIVPIILLGTLGTLSGLCSLFLLTITMDDKRETTIKSLIALNNRVPTEQEIIDEIKSLQKGAKIIGIPLMITSIASFAFMVKKIKARSQAKKALAQIEKTQTSPIIKSA